MKHIGFCVVLLLVTTSCAGLAPNAHHSLSMAAARDSDSEALAGIVSAGTDAGRASSSGYTVLSPEALDDLDQPDAGAAARHDNTGTDEEPQSRRLLIYTAHLTIRVANLDSAEDRFLDLIEARGGYLERRENNTLTCRVPAIDFEEVLEETKTFGTVIAQNREAQDVSRQHLDLSIRLDNAVAARDRLLELLEKATDVADLLEVERELKRLTEEIERLKGELRFLEGRIALSTISVTFNAPARITQRSRRFFSRFEWINRIGVEYVLDQF